MNCERCGGFKVYDYFYGASPCDGFRCINCGAITDMRMIMPAFRPSERASRRLRPKNRPAGATLSHAGPAHPGQTEGQP
jgi:hypothetical protein